MNKIRFLFNIIVVVVIFFLHGCISTTQQAIKPGFVPGMQISKAQFRGLYHKTNSYPEGKALWKYVSNNAIESSAVVYKDLVIFGSNDHFVYAVNLSNGLKVWEFKTDGQVVSSPAIAGGIVYFGSKDAKIYALDAQSGVIKWSYATNGEVVSSPAIENNVLLFL